MYNNVIQRMARSVAALDAATSMAPPLITTLSIQIKYQFKGNNE